jgi:hypothetical protein
VRVRRLPCARYDSDGCDDWVREVGECLVISPFGGIARKRKHLESLDDDRTWVAGRRIVDFPRQVNDGAVTEERFVGWTVRVHFCRDGGGVDARNCRVVTAAMLVVLLISVFHGEEAGNGKQRHRHGRERRRWVDELFRRWRLRRVRGGVWNLLHDTMNGAVTSTASGGWAESDQFSDAEGRDDAQDTDGTDEGKR